MIFENGDRIVFAGDSVTDMGRAYPLGEGRDDKVGRSYVRIIENMLVTYYPERLIRITNAGISGNTSRDLLERYDRDVLALTPDWVSICIGINDVWRQFDSPTISDFHIDPKTYEQNLETMLCKTKPSVKGIFLLTPYYMEPSRNDDMRARMDEYCLVCHHLAEKYGCVLVDFQDVYTRFLKFRHSSSIAWDRVHPNQIGATLMARAFLDKCGFDYNHRSY